MHTEPPKKNFDCHSRVDRLVDIGVVHDDEGRLAAELEADRLDAFGAERVDLAARADAPGHRDEVGALVRHEMRANRSAVANDDIDDTLRYAGASAEFAKHQRGQRRQLVRLDDDGVARHQRRADLAGEQRRGEIPGGDAGDHPIGHALNPDLLVAAFARQDLALESPRALGGVAQQNRSEIRVDAQFRQELAPFGGEKRSQRLGVLVDQIGEFLEQRAALHRRSSAPFGLSFAGRRDGAIRVLDCGGRHRGDDALVLRILDLAPIAAG